MLSVFWLLMTLLIVLLVDIMNTTSTDWMVFSLVVVAWLESSGTKKTAWITVVFSGVVATLSSEKVTRV